MLDEAKAMQLEHVAGGTYLCRRAEAAKTAIEGGSTNATTLGLGETFGAEFRSDDLAQVTELVEEGPVEVGGIQYEVQNGAADTYDLVIPAANAVYTHMLGGACHSIMPSVDAMDAMVTMLEGYQQAVYTSFSPATASPRASKPLPTRSPTWKTPRKSPPPAPMPQALSPRWTRPIPPTPVTTTSR